MRIVKWQQGGVCPAVAQSAAAAAPHRSQPRNTPQSKHLDINDRFHEVQSSSCFLSCTGDKVGLAPISLHFELLCLGDLRCVYCAGYRQTHSIKVYNVHMNSPEEC